MKNINNNYIPPILEGKTKQNYLHNLLSGAYLQQNIVINYLQNLKNNFKIFTISLTLLYTHAIAVKHSHMRYKSLFLSNLNDLVI